MEYRAVPCAEFVDSGMGRQYRSRTPLTRLEEGAAGSEVDLRTDSRERASHPRCVPGGVQAMDYPKLDKVRRSAAPLQLDVIEAFAAGRLSRREFVQRAAILGLSMGSISAVIAACSGGSASP